eukprot:COSAG02_NODE_5668_length_4142_cov_5.602770_2_plen_154_part_00
MATSHSPSTTFSWGSSRRRTLSLNVDSPMPSSWLGQTSWQLRRSHATSCRLARSDDNVPRRTVFGVVQGGGQREFTGQLVYCRSQQSAATMWPCLRSRSRSTYTRMPVRVTIIVEHPFTMSPVQYHVGHHGCNSRHMSSVAIYKSVLVMCLPC